MLVGVAGCSRAVQDGAPPGPNVMEPPAAECLAVAQTLVDAIAGGLIPGVTVSSAGAVVAPDRSETWFVATKLAGNGLGDDSVAVFATNRGADDSVPGLIIGVGGFAAEFSDWPEGETSAFAFSITEDGVEEAESCVR